MNFFPPSWRIFAAWLQKTNKGCDNYIVALPFALKKYLKAREELWKLKYFTMQK
jgi:hypothetical protein